MKRLALLALPLALAGCGSKIDGDKLEDEIAKDAEALPDPLVLDGVDCPSPDKEAGDRFTCVVTVKGQDTELEVTQVDDDGRVTYNGLATIAEGPAVSDIEADKASIESVVDGVNKDITALCDYADPEFRKELAEDENCAQAAPAEYESPLLEDYRVRISEDTAVASADGRSVIFARQNNGSWLITDVR